MNDELDQLLDTCRATYRGPGKCLSPKYLRARAAYHTALVARRMLDPKLADLVVNDEAS